MAKVHNVLEMWHGSPNLAATQTGSSTQNNQMAAVGYISEMEEIVRASWPHFRHHGGAAFTLSERSPLPPALSATDLPGGPTKLSNVGQIRRFNRDPVKGDDDSTPGCILDTENWLNSNGDLDNSTHSKDNYTSDDGCDIERDNGIADAESPEQQDVNATPTVHGSIRPMRKSKRLAEMVFVTVNTIEKMWNKGIKNE